MRTGQLAADVLENAAGDPGEHCPAGRLFRLQVVQCDLSLIIKHFFKVRHVPLLIHGVAVETAAHMVMQSALRHFLQRMRRHLHGVRTKVRLQALPRRAAKKKVDHRCARKFWRAAKSAPPDIVRLIEILVAFCKRAAGGLGQ